VKSSREVAPAPKKKVKTMPLERNAVSKESPKKEQDDRGEQRNFGGQRRWIPPRKSKREMGRKAITRHRKNEKTAIVKGREDEASARFSRKRRRVRGMSEGKGEEGDQCFTEKEKGVDWY